MTVSDSEYVNVVSGMSWWMLFFPWPTSKVENTGFNMKKESALHIYNMVPQNVAEGSIVWNGPSQQLTVRYVFIMTVEKK